MHVVSKGGHCLSAARSTSLKEPRQRQSCFHSSISICTQSSWPLRHQTSATGATFLRNNSGDDNEGWEHDGDADDTYFSTVNHIETSNFWTLTPVLFIHLPSRSIFLGVPSWAGRWFRVHEGSHGDHSIFSVSPTARNKAKKKKHDSPSRSVYSFLLKVTNTHFYRGSSADCHKLSQVKA